MWKKYKKTLCLTSVLILLPLVVGVCCWNILPERMPVHFGVDGQPDRYGSRVEAVLLLPLGMLVLQWLLVFATGKDRGNAKQSRKVMVLGFWIIPVVTVFMSALIYAVALEYTLAIMPCLAVGFGVLFLVIGNYMPKIKHNRTIGIRIPWTLADEANWNATHRFAGRVSVCGGVLLLLASLLPSAALPWVAVSVMLLIVACPVAFSWQYHKRKK